jgi:uncharacterized membrane protein
LDQANDFFSLRGRRGRDRRQSCPLAQAWVEAIGALVIGIGMLLAAWRFIAGFPPAVVTFADVRLTLARFPAIALEFQLGADILSTAVAPTWDAIGKLAAVAVI